MGMEKLKDLKHLYVTVFLSSLAMTVVVPAITDVTMSALCPGRDQCSLAIFLSGFQQAIIGMGSVVMMPLMGNLSDHYGRKALLTLPLTLSIFPLLILACSRETNFFYAYYVVKTLTAIVSEGSINCLALAYLADNISERQRTSAFGILSGVVLTSFVCGTLAARFFSTAFAFQVAAVVSMVAAAYMRIFLKESVPERDEMARPILKGEGNDILDLDDDGGGDFPREATTTVFKKIPSVAHLVSLLRTSVKFSQTAVVAFFHSLAEGGMQACILYYLKARFHFGKNEYAVILLLVGVAGMVSQLLLMPWLVSFIAEEKLLSIGLFAGFANLMLYSISWADWVPYATTVFALFSVFALPSLRSIASKQVGASEQGKAQGCISGISSFANIVSPLIFSPLTALFLSERAPFNFPGFSIMCIGFAMMIAFIQSVLIRPVPSVSTIKFSNTDTNA